MIEDWYKVDTIQDLVNIIQMVSPTADYRMDLSLCRRDRAFRKFSEKYLRAISDYKIIHNMFIGTGIGVLKWDWYWDVATTQYCQPRDFIKRHIISKATTVQRFRCCVTDPNHMPIKIRPETKSAAAECWQMLDTFEGSQLMELKVLGEMLTDLGEDWENPLVKHLMEDVHYRGCWALRRLFFGEYLRHEEWIV
jgi:hypothetical protein